MDKWPTIAVASGVAVTIAVQELLHEGVHPHATHGIEILDPLQGKLAIEAATSGTITPPPAGHRKIVDTIVQMWWSPGA